MLLFPEAPMYYVCAPYAGESTEAVRANIDRARQVGQALIRRFPRSAVLVPHLLGQGGLYGSAEDDGRSSPARVTAIAQGTAWAAQTARAGGVLVLVTRDDHTLSAGCMAELNAFLPNEQALQWNRIVRAPFDEMLARITDGR